MKAVLSLKRLLLVISILIPVYFIGYKVFYFYLVVPAHKMEYHVKVIKQINKNQMFLLKMPVLFNKDYVHRKIDELQQIAIMYEKNISYISSLDFSSKSNVDVHNYLVGLAKLYPAIFARQACIFIYIILPWSLLGSLLISFIFLFSKLKVFFLTEKKEKLRLVPDFKPEVYIPQGTNKIGNSLTPVSDLFSRIYSNYPEMPASIDNHQSYPGGLLDHIKGIYEFLLKELDNIKLEYPHIPDYLIIDSCVGHDLGKILTYYQVNSIWMSYAAYHDKFSGIVVNALKDEIIKHYAPEQYSGLYYSTAYHHTPKDVPVDAPVYVQDLITIINKADYYAAQMHVKKAQDIVLKNKQAFVQSFLKITPYLNINGWQKGYPDGFYFPPEEEKQGVVLLFWGNIRSKLINVLPEEVKVFFKYKKAVYSILPVFYNEMKNIFLTEFEGNKVSSTGTFSIMGRTDVVILNDIVFPQEIRQKWLLGRQLKRNVVQKDNIDNSMQKKQDNSKEEVSNNKTKT